MPDPGTGLMNSSPNSSSTETALQAYRRGYTPIPLRDHTKKPYSRDWTQQRWSGEEQVRDTFERAEKEGMGNVGLVLGRASGGLIDVDFDHAAALRFQYLLMGVLATPMLTGRPGRPRSHFWYVADPVPDYIKHTMPDGSSIVELRGDGHQTVIPPSIHPTGEAYRWEFEPWGGEEGPAAVDGTRLAVHVGLIGLGAVLQDRWPSSGDRHEAYLALAGGLLRYGDGVHPYWERNLSGVIEALTQATHDRDGAAARKAEVIATTVRRLREGGQATGWNRLADMIGTEHAEQARRIARKVERLAGYGDRPEIRAVEERLVSSLPPEERNPVAERISTWEPIDLEPYLTGDIVLPKPTLLTRTDGQALFYPGRVNMLFGRSEGGKSMVAMLGCLQEMAKGERTLYIDCEDEPSGVVSRMRQFGAGVDDIRSGFTYLNPDEPLSLMQRDRWGKQEVTEKALEAWTLFQQRLDEIDPALIVLDGTTSLYRLHGLDTNDSVATDVINGWLKKLLRGGRTTVQFIDHTGKGSQRGAWPIGSQHKIAMIQGTAIQVHPIDQPMPGVLARLELIIAKDRPGMVRAAATESGRQQVAGICEIDSRDPTFTRILIRPMADDEIIVGDNDEDISAAVKKAHTKKATAARSEKSAQDRLRVRNEILTQLGGDMDAVVNMGDIIDTTGMGREFVRKVFAALQKDGVLFRVAANRADFKLVPPE